LKGREQGKQKKGEKIGIESAKKKKKKKKNKKNIQKLA